MDLLLPALLWLFLLFSCIHAEVHYQEFVIEATPVKRLCKTHTRITVNGMLPGPTLEARNGDTMVIKAINRAKYNVTLHWHGIRQMRTAWADGPEFVTQCPIRPGESYTYKFTIEGQEGTLWWHAHSSWLRATVHGALIIYPKLGSAYPFIKPHREYPVLIGEWWNKNPIDVVRRSMKTGGAPSFSDAFTINGQPGDLYKCSSQETTVLPVSAGEAVLLRVINAALNNEHFIAVAGHLMTVVGADAAYTKPFTTPFLMLGPGQTTDVILSAPTTYPIGSRFYIAARAYFSPPGVPFDNTTTTAILEYSFPASSAIARADATVNVDAPITTTAVDANVNASHVATPDPTVKANNPTAATAAGASTAPATDATVKANALTAATTTGGSTVATTIKIASSVTTSTPNDDNNNNNETYKTDIQYDESSITSNDNRNTNYSKKNNNNHRHKPKHKHSHKHNNLLPPPLFPPLPAFNDSRSAAFFTNGIKSPGPVRLPEPVTEHLFFTVGLGLYFCPRSIRCGGPNNTRFAASMNNISFVLPNTISLLQANLLNIPGVFTPDFPPFPPVQFDYTGNNISPSLQSPIKGTKLYRLKYGSVVELVLQGTNIFSGEEHPMHLHGHEFYVLATGSGNFDPGWDLAKYNLVDPPLRNTIGVPVRGWAVIRFVANNPGVWLMHCHIDSHLGWGLAMAFITDNGFGELESIEPPPADLPIC